MPGKAVPSDPTAVRGCVRVSWPIGDDWLAILYGGITAAIKANYWDGSEDDVADCQLNVLEAIGETIDLGNCEETMVGVVVGWHSVTAPAGWFLCAGASYDISLYPVLFNILGVNLLPDFRGRVLVGKDDGGPLGTINASGGAIDVTLSIAEMPSHNHGITDGVYTGVGTAPDNRKRALAGTNGFSTSIGGGSAHENMSPYRVTNWIIKHD